VAGVGRGAPPFPVAAEAWLVLERLWAAGHGAYLVGGAVRDALLGRETHDWDVATDARPDAILGLFPEGGYENRFGTVAAHGVEITTFRRDHHYADHRRPDRVTFTDSITDDLLRRDFTVNAIAWGRAAGAQPEAADIVDPSGGRADLQARILRAVGEPAARFDEDALRLLRAARLAAAVGLLIEPETLAAMRRHAADVRWVSQERVGIELRRMVEAADPSVAFRIMADTGVLQPAVPELAARIGRSPHRSPGPDAGAGHDAFDHALATLDASAVLDPGDERLRLAALLHDLDAVIAEGLLVRVAHPRHEARRIGRIIGGQGFRYTPDWSDADVRRFLRRTGPDVVDDVLRLRRADNVACGWPPDHGDVDQLRVRVEAQRAAGVPLSLADLEVDGTDLMVELDRPGGPWLGALLERLLDVVTDEPHRNTKRQLLLDAHRWADQGRA